MTRTASLVGMGAIALVWRVCPASAQQPQKLLPTEQITVTLTDIVTGEPGDPITVRRLKPPNLLPVVVLSQLDIDGDRLPDGAQDTDGDGLPDNWEAGGEESVSDAVGRRVDRVVRIPAPTAIGPGTPPTFIFSRRAVVTSATDADTDNDGLSDFIEVFGLKFIDDNGDGRLNFIFTDANANGRWDPGEAVSPESEWFDANNDGMPSVGEFPLPNVNPQLNRQNDFDGFVFTDPTNPDTDGDGIPDGDDVDPLINPRTFNVPGSTFQRVGGPDPDDADLDNDGLGNGSDFGNDLEEVQAVDFPADLSELLAIFRDDLLALDPPVLPEAVIEDLIGADWDGNGLFRITDIRDWTPIVIEEQIRERFPAGEFFVGNHALFREQSIADIRAAGAVGYQNAAARAARSDLAAGRIVGLGLGYQELLRPLGGPQLPFLPDIRLFAILYAWRMSGFDIDGDGFVGAPSPSRGTTGPDFNDPSSIAIALGPDNTALAGVDLTDAQNSNFCADCVGFDDRLPLANAQRTDDAIQLDGRIEVPFSITLPCGALGLIMPAMLALLGVVVPRRGRRGHRPASRERTT